jgi:hypothetical protein
MRGNRLAPLLAILAALTARPVAAQVVRGTLVDAATERAVVGATVRLLDGSAERGATVTDSSGAWSLTIPAAPGSYRVRAEKAGYATVVTRPLVLDRAGAIVFHLRTRPQVTVLEGVTGGSEQVDNYSGFLERERRRMGVSLGPDEVRQRIERLGATKPSRVVGALLPGLEFSRSPTRRNVLLMPSRAAGRVCEATIVIDGKRYSPIDGAGKPRLPPWDLDRLVSLDDIRAVEIYHDPTFVPASLGLLNLNPGFGRGCGVVVIWTHAGIGVE